VLKDDFVKTIKNLRVGFGDVEIKSLLATYTTSGTTPCFFHWYLLAMTCLPDCVAPLLDGKVNYREWIKKLHVVYREIEFAHRETEDWLELAIQEASSPYFC
jgi:hypothetical protein